MILFILYIYYVWLFISPFAHSPQLYKFINTVLLLEEIKQNKRKDEKLTKILKYFAKRRGRKAELANFFLQ